MIKKPRVFYLAWTPPSENGGACLAMRRHFIEHDDFSVFVATSGEFDALGVPSLRLKNPPWLDRIGQTRFWRWVRNYDFVLQAGSMPGELIRAAKAFRPDVVFTVADLTWSESARRLALWLKVPLITNFQDWWPRGQFYYAQEKPFGWIVPLLERRFRRLCKESDLVFCTSDGMKDFLGPHPNSHVLYPIGARKTGTGTTHAVRRQTTGKRRLLYTGTSSGSYGELLLTLAKRLGMSTTWELVIYGVRPDWQPEELARAKTTGLYRGFLPFEQLKAELLTADACLSVMSFDPALEVMMRTSFTTKVLDYCSAGRPVVMWGPGFCSPIRLASQHGAALTVEDADPAGVIECLRRIDDEPGLAESLALGSIRLAEGDLSHDRIHSVFVKQIGMLLGHR